MRVRMCVSTCLCEYGCVYRRVYASTDVCIDVFMRVRMCVSTCRRVYASTDGVCLLMRRSLHVCFISVSVSGRT
ncbi:hypothetical protein WUBG_06738, partial [Wuchereria bancrofti]